MSYRYDPADSSGQRREVTSDDFDGLDGVPTYDGSSSTSSLGSSRGYEPPSSWPDPTELFPRTNTAQSQEIYPAPTTSFDAVDDNATSTLDRQAYEFAPAEPEGSTAIEVERNNGRGTIDLGLLLLRVVLGGFLTFHAVQTFFNLGASSGIGGLEAAFSGYLYGGALAVIVPTIELAAGVFVLLGLLTPVAAMFSLVVTGFMAAHNIAASGIGINPLMWGPEQWLPIMLFGAALTHQFTGPGFYAVDSGRSWAERPMASSWIFAVVGFILIAAMWWFGTGINPFA